MVKAKELRSGNNHRFTREGSVETVSNKYNKPRSTREGSVNEPRSTREGYPRDERDQWTEESSSSDETDSVESREKIENEREKSCEKDGAKLAAEHNFEKNDFVNRIKDLFALNNVGSKITNTSSSLGKPLILLSILFILLIFGIPLYTGNNTNNVNINNEKISYETRVKHFLNTIKKLQNDFPSQENILWTSLFQKIKYVNESRPTRPAVMILIYNNSKEVAECIAWNIGRAASYFLNTPDMIQLIGDSDMNETDNELVSQYKEPLKKNGVMIVYRLDEIPGLVAQSFHTFCDTYNPLVERAVLLFTLDNSRLRNAENIKPTRKAMEVLKLLWKGTLVDSKLNSLITRLTDSVLEIRSEKNVKCLK